MELVATQRLSDVPEELVALQSGVAVRTASGVHLVFEDRVDPLETEGPVDALVTYGRDGAGVLRGRRVTPIHERDAVLWERGGLDLPDELGAPLHVVRHGLAIGSAGFWADADAGPSFHPVSEIGGVEIERAAPSTSHRGSRYQLAVRREDGTRHVYTSEVGISACD